MSYKILLSSKLNCPLVSVIIPMYNAAKFIPQTLESLLYQTMKDFEVVIIDDCSTDNSVEVVESFADRFKEGQLQVLKLSKNTGSPGLPRNAGIKFAHGKYISFLDSDDLYTKTALEELTTLAEEYKADAIHSNQIFSLWGRMYTNKKTVDDPEFTDIEKLTNPANFYTMYEDRPHPSKPTLKVGDIAERVKKFSLNDYSRETVLTFYRRDFLITNQNFFPAIGMFEDELFTFKGMCLARKLLFVPNIWYIVRPLADSVTRKQFNRSAEIHKKLRVFIDGFHTFVNIMNSIKFFSENPDYRYDVLNWFVQDKPYLLRDIYKENNPADLYPLIEKEFSSEEASFAAYLFNTMKIQQFQIEKLQAELRKFQKQ